MTKIDTLIAALAQAPNSQIDHTITPKLKLLIGKTPNEVATKIKAILDECAHASLASDFAMNAMDIVWNMALDNSIQE